MGEAREGAGRSSNAMGPPALCQPTVASHVLGVTTGTATDSPVTSQALGDALGRPARDAGTGVRQPPNQGPELRGSTPGYARRCFLKFSRT